MSRIEASLINIITTIPDFAGRLNTTSADITYDGNVYKGIGNILEISGITNSSKQLSKRVRVQFDASQAENRKQLKQLDSSVRIRVDDIYSDDFGKTWQPTGLRFMGQVSNVDINDDFYFSCELETARSLQRQAPLIIWSDTAQQQRFPGDRCFKYAKKISEGIESQF